MFISYLFSLLGRDPKFRNLGKKESLYLEQEIPMFLFLKEQKYSLLLVSLALCSVIFSRSHKQVFAALLWVWTSLASFSQHDWVQAPFDANHAMIMRLVLFYTFVVWGKPEK